MEGILKKIVKGILKRYKPEVVVILGNKTSLGGIIFSVLSGREYKKTKVKIFEDNLSDELNLIFAIIGQKNIFLAALVGFLKIMSPIKLNYPKILIFKYSDVFSGCAKAFLQIIRPNIVVVSSIDDIDIEDFNRDDWLREGAKFVESLSVRGYAILNSDDEGVVSLRDRTRANILTYGNAGVADIRISNLENANISSETGGVSFKIGYQGSFVPIIHMGAHDKQYAYKVAAGFAVGVAHGMNLVKIEELIREG